MPNKQAYRYFDKAQARNCRASREVGMSPSSESEFLILEVIQFAVWPLTLNNSNPAKSCCPETKMPKNVHPIVLQHSYSQRQDRFGREGLYSRRPFWPLQCLSMSVLDLRQSGAQAHGRTRRSVHWPTRH